MPHIYPMKCVFLGEKDPSQLVFSHVYREQAPAVTWHTTEEEDQGAVDTEL